ncbi:MAG: universal stress protein [Kiritimatiellae bacterium]|nr:universal stress protein [Kiritimatiellia bacterium]
MKLEVEQILCATDFSDSAAHAFQYALAIAAHHGASVELLHVAECSIYANGPPLKREESGGTFEDRLRERLDEIAASQSVDVPIETTVVNGVPSVEIVKHAEASSADLIVLGTHGRTGLKHLLVGSVAEKVIRSAACPVCTVRYPDLKTNTSKEA